MTLVGVYNIKRKLKAAWEGKIKYRQEIMGLNKKKNISAIFAAFILFMGLIEWLPSEVLAMFQTAAFFSSAYVAFLCYLAVKEKWPGIFCFVALLIISSAIALSFEWHMWNTNAAAITNAAAGLFFLTSVFALDLNMSQAEIDRKTKKYIKRGEALKRVGLYRRALSAFKRATRINPDSPEIWLQYGETLKDLAMGAKAKSEGAFVSGLGDRKGDWKKLCKKALDAFDRAAEINPDSADALLNRGEVLIWMQRNEEALAALEKAVGISPDNQKALHLRGLALDQVGKDKESRLTIENAKDR